MRLFPVALLACFLAPVAAESAHPEWWQEASAVRWAVPALVVTDEAIALDGDLSEWQDRPALPLGLTHQTTFDRDWRGRFDLSANLRLAASPTALWFAAEVQDDKLLVAPGNDRLRGDLLRCWVAAGAATAAEARALVVQPAWSHDGVDEAAAVVDADRREAIPGAVVAWQATEKGYRVEGRVPWPALPGAQPAAGDLRGLAVQVVDWDDAAAEKAALVWPASIRPPPAAPPAKKVNGYDPPALPPPTRPQQFGELRVLERFDLDQAGPFLASLLPIGAENSFYEAGETVKVLGLNGLGTAVAATLDAHAVTEAGEVQLLSRGDFWTEGAVTGVMWSWRTPWDFAASVLVAAWLDRPALAEQRVYGRIESVGTEYKAHLERLQELRTRMLASAAAAGSDARRRRYLGAVLINLEDREQSQSAWSSWMSRDDVDRLATEIGELEALYQQALAGQDPYAGRKGTFLRGYVSDIDDTVQHYSVSIPDNWTPASRLPLLISLHGYGFGKFHGHPAPSYPDAVAVACYGRGNGDYKLWCERDILTVVDAMIEDYGIDQNRVWCTGGSMGGTGSWHMATMFPDRFAAIGPTAGNANHHVWEEVWGWGQREPTFLTPFRNWIESTTSAFQYAENLRNVGVYCLHGAIDNICPVGHARTMCERLRNFGYDAVYEEFADVGHGGFPAAAANRQKSFLFSRSRDPYPRHVTYKASFHRYSGAYWAWLERFAEQATDAQIDARIDGQRIRVATVNLRRFRLELNEHLVDLGQPVTVEVDGEPAFVGPVPPGGVIRIGFDGSWKQVEAPRGLAKNPVVGGPIEHAFMSRFLVVCGTAGDRRTNEVNRRMADQLAEKWRRWGREQPARLKMDWEVTDQDLAESNLICLGGAASNRVVARVNDRLPIRFEGDAIVAGPDVYRGSDVGVKLCYPNPLNPEKYLCVFGGVTWEGTYDINGRFGNFFDWGVFDDRNYFDFAIFDAHTQSPETHLAMGYFDEDWALESARVFRGDPVLRQATRPRRPPDPLAPLPDGDDVYISELTPQSIRMEKGVLGYDQSFAGRPITLGSMVFERGLGVHPQAEVIYDIAGEFQSFEAWAGIDLEGADTVSKAREEAERVAFQVYGDGKLLADTGEMRWNTPPKHVVANVTGVRQLTLMARALDGRKWLFGDAGWGLARLSRRTDVRVAPPPLRIGADRLSLDGEWLLDEYEIGEGVSRGAEQDSPLLPSDRRVSLPGTVQAALQATGELPDPYQNDQIKGAAELAQREWWLYRRCDVPATWEGRLLWLALGGVSQFADVWVNGTWVGQVTGPHATAELDITRAVRWGQTNLVAIRLLAGPAPWTNVKSFAAPPRESVLGLASSYGADGGGICIPLGVTRPIVLRAGGWVRSTPLRVAAQPAAGQAVGTLARVPCSVVVETTLTNLDKAAHNVVLKGTIEALDGLEPPVPFERRLRLTGAESVPLRVVVPVPAMRLWWPGALGQRPRYRAALEVRADDLLSDAGEARFGVRRVELPAAGGEASLAVNGTPLTLRIAEWRTLDRLLRPDHSRCEQILRLAAETGFNTLRVAAGTGLADADFYDLCDQLGLLVIQDLPLLGDVSKAALGDVAAAIEGTVLATRNHPCVVAFAQGADVPESVAARERLDLADTLLRQSAPDRFIIAATSSAAGPATWAWVDQAAADDLVREARLLTLTQISLPTAPSTDLTWLDREALPLSERAAPWPLTDWWRLRGGSDADLTAAQSWLGPARSDEAMLDLLTRWQAEAARRQAGLATAAGGAVYVTGLNESWPRVGGALIDYRGWPRPARDVLRRYLAGPVAFATPSAYDLRPGDALVADCYARYGGGAQWWERKPADWTKLVCRVEGLDGHVWAAQELPLTAELESEEPVGNLVWQLDAATPPGAYLLITEAPGSGVEPEVVPLAVRTSPTPPTRLPVLWLAAEPPAWPGLEPVTRDQLLTTPYAAVYCGPGSLAPLTELEAAALQLAVEEGAGLVIAGPPTWLAGTSLSELLPLRPVLGPTTGDLAPVRPEAAATDHPALAGLRGAWPEGSPGELAELAPGAEVLVRFGQQRPLLAEGRGGEGRVLELLVAADYHRRLAAWDGHERLLAGLLAYAAKLPFGEAKRLVSQPAGPPLAGLRDLPAAPLKLTVSTEPLVAEPDRPAVREIRVRNDGGTPVPLVSLRLTGLPAGLTASFSSASGALLPGRERTVLLTLRSTRRGRRAATVALTAAGWGAREARVELAVETR